jgi:hypothetical protein
MDLRMSGHVPTCIYIKYRQSASFVSEQQMKNYVPMLILLVEKFVTGISSSGINIRFCVMTGKNGIKH